MSLIDNKETDVAVPTSILSNVVTKGGGYRYETPSQGIRRQFLGFSTLTPSGGSRTRPYGSNHRPPEQQEQLSKNKTKAKEKQPRGQNGVVNGGDRDGNGKNGRKYGFTNAVTNGAVVVHRGATDRSVTAKPPCEALNVEMDMNRKKRDAIICMSTEKDTKIKKQKKASSRDESVEVRGYISDIYYHLYQAEKKFRIDATYIRRQKYLTIPRRALVVDWIVCLQKHLILSNESLFLAVNIFDRYLSKTSSTTAPAAPTPAPATPPSF